MPELPVTHEQEQQLTSDSFTKEPQIHGSFPYEDVSSISLEQVPSTDDSDNKTKIESLSISDVIPSDSLSAPTELNQENLREEPETSDKIDKEILQQHSETLSSITDEFTIPVLQSTQLVTQSIIEKQTIVVEDSEEVIHPSLLTSDKTTDEIDQILLSSVDEGNKPETVATTLETIQSISNLLENQNTDQEASLDKQTNSFSTSSNIVDTISTPSIDHQFIIEPLDNDQQVPTDVVIDKIDQFKEQTELLNDTNLPEATETSDVTATKCEQMGIEHVTSDKEEYISTAPVIIEEEQALSTSDTSDKTTVSFEDRSNRTEADNILVINDENASQKTRYDRNIFSSLRKERWIRIDEFLFFSFPLVNQELVR